MPVSSPATGACVRDQLVKSMDKADTGPVLMKSNLVGA
jgi:hypothetical protein